MVYQDCEYILMNVLTVYTRPFPPSLGYYLLYYQGGEVLPTNKAKRWEGGKKPIMDKTFGLSLAPPMNQSRNQDPSHCSDHFKISTSGGRVDSSQPPVNIHNLAIGIQALTRTHSSNKQTSTKVEP